MENKMETLEEALEEIKRLQQENERLRMLNLENIGKVFDRSMEVHNETLEEISEKIQSLFKEYIDRDKK